MKNETLLKTANVTVYKTPEGELYFTAQGGREYAAINDLVVENARRGEEIKKLIDSNTKMRRAVVIQKKLIESTKIKKDKPKHSTDKGCPESGCDLDAPCPDCGPSLLS
ncbi:hypothetical protein KAR91_66745 [Candidatus Pacearchaeota archaeon]|nr:hypothetical protein [Candidatus Pacearchaeota archaeon]